MLCKSTLSEWTIKHVKVFIRFLRARHVAQWYNTLVIIARPWVPSLELHRTKYSKTQTWSLKFSFLAMTSKNVLEHPMCVLGEKQPDHEGLPMAVWTSSSPGRSPAENTSSPPGLWCMWHSRQVHRRYVVGGCYHPMISALPNSNV